MPETQYKTSALLGVMLLFFSLRAFGQSKPYALSAWSHTSLSKGRFQDREYCKSPVIDRILADGKSAIPVLIVQITDTRTIPGPVFAYWPPITAGELAHFILQDLFLDETWQHRTMPELFPGQKCKDAAFICWSRFKEHATQTQIQARWQTFWNRSKDQIYWDSKSLCFRLAARPAKR